jgi:hypothetical protein
MELTHPPPCPFASVSGLISQEARFISVARKCQLWESANELPRVDSAAGRYDLVGSKDDRQAPRLCASHGHPGLVLMALKKGFRIRLAHVAIEDLWIRPPEIDKDQRIENVVEMRVRAEPKELPPELHVVFQQDGNSLLIGFDVGNKFRKILDVVEQPACRIHFIRFSSPGLGRVLRFDQASQIGETSSPAKGDHELPGKSVVALVDADRPEQGGVFGP